MGGLFLFFLLLSSRHIMQYVIPLNYVQSNPLITSEQQLNVNSLNLTSTSKNYLVSFYCCLMALLLFAISIWNTHHLPASFHLCFYELFLPSGRQMNQISLVHYQPKINYYGFRHLTCGFSFIIVICRHGCPSHFKTI